MLIKTVESEGQMNLMLWRAAALFNVLKAFMASTRGATSVSSFIMLQNILEYTNSCFHPCYLTS